MKRFFLPLTAYSLGLFLSGCATSYNVATDKSETLFFNTEREVQMGEAVAKRVEQEYKLVHDPELLARLDRIAVRVAAQSDRKDLVYRFHIVEEKEPNAFALPGGIIYVTSGLLTMAKSDDELASVLGHEIGHAAAKHVVKRIQGAMGLQLLQVLTASTGAADARTQAGMDLAFASLLLAYSQADELEADRLGTRYLKRAGYEPLAGVDFLTRLKEHTFRQAPRKFSYFRTHPYFGERLRQVRAEATGQIQFDDYINQTP